MERERERKREREREREIQCAAEVNMEFNRPLLL